MITEALLNFFAGLAGWFVGLMGTADPPAWIADASGALSDVIGYAAGLGAWFPFLVLGIVGGFLLTLWVALWSVKGARWVWGITPFSGGS